jgi:serine/threonine protein phosphatase PrpC
MQFETGAVSHVGNVRKVNEDSLFTSEAHGVWLVADGMGGHRDGKLASSIVVEAAKTLGRPASAPDLLSRFNDRILRANAQLAAMSNGDDHSIIGSTVAAVLVYGRHFACVWAGDSRVYLVRETTISQISKDHTEVQELLDKGVIQPSEAKTWPRRNVITRAIGVGDDPGLDLVQGKLQDGDTFVICSDGLTGHVEDEEILAHVAGHSVEGASDTLVQLALERGGKDNVTVVVLRVRQDGKATVIRRASDSA